jgi:hypothetical protein
LAKVEGEGTNHVLHLDNSNNLNWLPEEIVKEAYRLGLPAELQPGDYNLKIKMEATDMGKKKNVHLGLQNELMDNDGYYQLFSITVK